MRNKPSVIVGLGNPEEHYAGTLHNAGYDVVHRLAVRYNARAFLPEPDLAAMVAIDPTGLWIFVKPNTGMNSSGLAVKAVVERYNLPLEQLLLVYDEVALPLGKLQVKMSTSSGGHNGVASVIAELGQRKNFNCLRVAVGPHPGGDKLYNFVLSPPTAEVAPRYNRVLDVAAEAASVFGMEGAQKAMNVFNGKAVD